MNFAFPAFLIFLLLLPGLFFTLTFYNTENKPLNYIPLTHKAAVSFFVTILLHLVWIILICGITSCHINFTRLLIILSGIQGELYTSTIQSITVNNLIGITAYLVTIYAFAYLIGRVLRGGIRTYKLDKIFRILRLDSPWYYLFTGYDWEDGEPDGVIISAVVEVAGRGYLYLGYLENFFLNDEGNIDRLVLTSAWRRSIENDKSMDGDDSFQDRFYAIDGDYFVLNYNEIKNLNVQFLKVEEIPT